MCIRDRVYREESFGQPQELFLDEVLRYLEPVSYTHLITAAFAVSHNEEAETPLFLPFEKKNQKEIELLPKVVKM